MKKLLFAFMAMTLFACSSDDSAPVDPNNGNPNPENPNPENPNPENPNPENPNPENPNPVECTNVYTGNVWLKTQAEVDAFAANGYCKIEGGLSIGAEPEGVPSDITDVSELESLEGVTKYIAIIDAPVLTSLNGLQNIKNVTQIFIHKTGITNLLGCPDFAEGAKVEIGQTEISLEGFVPKNYMSIALYGDVNLGHFSSYPNVLVLTKLLLSGIEATTLEGLENIKQIGELAVRYSPNLISLKGLENVTKIENLEISINPELISIADLHSLTAVETVSGIDGGLIYPGISINNNEKLSSLHGLENLVSFEGNSLNIYFNPQLTDFCALSLLVQNDPVEFWYVYDNGPFSPTQANVGSGNCSQP